MRYSGIDPYRIWTDATQQTTREGCHPFRFEARVPHRCTCFLKHGGRYNSGCLPIVIRSKRICIHSKSVGRMHEVLIVSSNDTECRCVKLLDDSPDAVSHEHAREELRASFDK